MLELAAGAFSKDPQFERIRGWVADSSEGGRTVIDAIDKDVALPVIALSLFTRFRSRVGSDGRGSFIERLLAALRNEFGGTYRGRGHDRARRPRLAQPIAGLDSTGVRRLTLSVAGSVPSTKPQCLAVGAFQLQRGTS
jgi:hypothetical protein